jgi:hypothetical protein
MPSKSYQPRREPAWADFLAEVEAGVIRITEQQRKYLDGRLSGLSHQDVVAGLGLKTFPGFRLRGRLIDGWERLLEIRNEQRKQAAS